MRAGSLRSSQAAAWAALRRSIPPRSDVRWPFALLLSAYAVLGFSTFGFNRTPLQMLLIVASGCGLDLLLSALAGRGARFPLSAYITCTSLALLLNYAHDSWVLLLPVLLAVGSKYVFTFAGRHVFNPSLFAVTACLLLTRDVITTAPAYQWAGGDVTLSFAMIALALVTFLPRVGRSWLVGSFLAFYALQTALRAYIMRHHIPPSMLLLGTVSAPAFFLFTFYMITDPATSPSSRRGQVLMALAITSVDLYLHLFESVFTFFYAAFAIAALKWAFLHARAAWRRASRATLAARGFPAAGLPAPGLPAPGRGALVLRAALIGSAALAVFTAEHATGSALPAERVHFTLEPILSARSGLAAEMGSTLQEVDPRVAHVAKWLLSVGSSVAVADVNGDGSVDIFTTHPLAAPPHRAQLFLNRGGWRFSPVDIPALEPFNHDDHRQGIAAGATLVDYDGDGDTDILLAVSFGASRLLENRLRQNGRLRFVDVTPGAGLGEHHTSIHAGFFDFDRDAVLDVFVANVLATHLRGYDPPRPLNLFALPPPEYPGDRRALRFMHDGWHDADNGGENELYRGLGGGRFERFERIPRETRWSLAVCYSDLDHDGYTDLYVANDFGPDRLYHNRGGQRLESVVESRYGELGNDTYKGMNCSAGDVNNDSLPDLYISNVHHPLQAEGSLLWMNASTPGSLRLRDEATQRGALNPHRFGWGAALADLDGDGFLDIVQANGMVDDRLDPRGYERKDYWYVNHKLMQSGPEIHTYADMWGDIRGRVVFPNEQRRVYLNLGKEAPGHFADAAPLVGMTRGDNSRGVATADFDDDGDLDVMISNQHGPLSLFENTLAPAHRHFVGLSLQGNGSTTHRSALGTRVHFHFDGSGPEASQWREVSASSGLSAQSDPRLLVGLGPYAGAVHVEIHWYGGQMQHLELTSGRYHHVIQPDLSVARERGRQK